MEQVRPASPADLDRLTELVADYAVDRAGKRGADLVWPTDGGVALPDPLGQPLSVYLDEPDHTALVGTLDDWVAAVALCRVAGGGGESRGVLDLCFVEPGAREVGLGHLLIEHALAWFTDRGCTGVDGTAFPGDRAAKSFLESAGFKARLLVMHRTID